MRKSEKVSARELNARIRKHLGTLAPVSGRALRQRVNRALERDGNRLVAARGARAIQELGDLFIVDLDSNGIVEKDVDLEATARELGVLRDWEALVSKD
jgi:hypothetical protein